ncbi:Hint domain-containing protein [Paracoccus sediminicola]|uniref:Hint domain-containing protein n=1 Tax=Paracoccus sediminicola TaxID=3017783 RepID=UPI0022F0E0F8|nr:Hint domain-containing protein [Paracoccus sediminicola]WBU56799.1 Hint domain-containing protein [Paracoccus sediminicola]
MPPNLIINPNFDGNSLTGWTTTGDASTYAGSQELAVFDKSSNSGGSIAQNVTVEAGKSYDFSFDFGFAVNRVSGGSANVSYTIEAVDANGNVGPVIAQGQSTDSTGTDYRLSSAADTPVATQFTVPAGVTEIRVTISGGVSNSTSRDAVVDDVYLGVVCFTAGTMIATPDGPRAVETLAEGSMVTTLTHGDQPIRWIGHRHLSPAELAAKPNLRPIRIRRSALGPGIPARDMVVSPQHRMLVSSAIVHRMYGANSVLIAARKLLPLHGVEEITADAPVDYWHFLCDRHEIVTADGALAETLYLGTQALRNMTDEARHEIHALFPDLLRGWEAPPAAVFAEGKRSKRLVARHLKNAKPLAEPFTPSPRAARRGSRG